MPVIPSLIDVFIALVIAILFFLIVIAIGFTLAALQKPEGHSMPAACFALPQMNFDNSRHIDEDREYYDDGEQPEYDPEDFYNTDSPDYDEDNSFIIRRDFLDEV